MLDPMRNDGVPICYFHNEKTVKVRKEHVCRMCGKMIRIGEQAYCHTVMTSDDRAPGSFYIHKEYCIGLD